MAFGADVGSGAWSAQTDMGPSNLALVISFATEESPNWPPVDSTQRDFAARVCSGGMTFVKAMLLHGAAGAVLLRPVARHAKLEPPQQLRVRHTSKARAVRAGYAASDQATQRNCAYQRLLVEDHEHDENPSALSLNSALTGKSAACDACPQAYQGSAKPPQLHGRRAVIAGVSYRIALRMLAVQMLVGLNGFAVGK